MRMGWHGGYEGPLREGGENWPNSMKTVGSHEMPASIGVSHIGNAGVGLHSSPTLANIVNVRNGSWN